MLNLLLWDSCSIRYEPKTMVTTYPKNIWKMVISKFFSYSCAGSWQTVAFSKKIAPFFLTIMWYPLLGRSLRSLGCYLIKQKLHRTFSIYQKSGVESNTGKAWVFKAAHALQPSRPCFCFCWLLLLLRFWLNHVVDLAISQLILSQFLSQFLSRFLIRFLSRFLSRFSPYMKHIEFSAQP